LDTISQGLVLSGIGLLVAFISMASFILIIVVLQIIFPPRAVSGEDAEEDSSEIEQAEEDEEGSIIVAIAAALISARASAHSELGKSLEAGRSGWWAANLMAARNASIEKNK
jgi:Na+-transporting methylmalonyl-CoA/oxaloacetate decarboxylase gamma subunit